MLKKVCRLIGIIIIGFGIIVMSADKKYYTLKKDDVTFLIENIEPVVKDGVEYTGMGGFYMVDDHYYWLRASKTTGEKSMFFTEENTEGTYAVKDDPESAIMLGHGNDLTYTKEGDYFYSTALEQNERAIARFRYDDETQEITDLTTYTFEDGKKRVDCIAYFQRDNKNRLQFLVRLQALAGEPVEFRIGRLEDGKFVTVQRFYVSDNTRYQAHLQGIFYRNNQLYSVTFDKFWKSKIQVYDMTKVLTTKETVILDEEDKKYDLKLNGNKFKKGWMDKFEIESIYVSKMGYIYFNANIKYGGIKEDKDCIMKINIPFN